MRAVNLLPEDTTARRIPKNAVVPAAGAFAALIAAGAVGVIAHSESGSVASKQRNLDELKAQLSRVQASKPSANATTAALLSSRDARLAALDTVLKARVPWQTMLRQLAVVLPSDTWLDSLNLTSPLSTDPAATPAAPADPTAAQAAPTDVVITG